MLQAKPPATRQGIFNCMKTVQRIKKTQDGANSVPLHVFDFTLFWDGDNRPSVDDMRSHLSTHCKKFAFQVERGASSGRLHYQGRFSLKVKARRNAVVTKVCTDFFSKASISVTHEHDNNVYVTKEETRVEGPWTDKDRIMVRKVANMQTLRQWQEQMKNLLLPYDDRGIHVIIDPDGNKGKTAFQKYMAHHHNAVWIPPLYDMKDIMQFVMSIPIGKIYIVNMPRAMNKTALGQFYAGMEQLKDGMLYDTRYHGKQMIIDEPNILVLTNVEPDVNMLSKDRWNLWKINGEILVNYHQ